MRAQHADGAKAQREQPADHQPHTAEMGRCAGIHTKQQGGQAQDDVHPHLGHDGEDGAHWRGGGTIGRHQPEVQRPQRGLGQEGHAQDGGARMQHAPVGVADLGDLHGHVGHVERAGDAVEHGHANQEQRRGREVDGDVVQAALHPCPARAMQQQAVGGREHDLEEDEQVEQVRREEGAREAHQLELEQRVVVHPRAVPARRREQDGCQPQQAAQQQHHGAEPVQRQHDAEGRRPVARQVDTDGGRGIGPLHPHQQGHGDHQPQRGGGDVEHQLGPAVLFLHQQHQAAGQHGQQDGGQQQVRHQQVGELAHALCPSCLPVGEGGATGSSSLPSTWSVPLRPREAIITTRNSAVMAKPITMAVSTSAWGIGSS